MSFGLAVGAGSLEDKCPEGIKRWFLVCHPRQRPGEERASLPMGAPDFALMLATRMKTSWAKQD